LIPRRVTRIRETPLAVLDALTPAERLAFVLHYVFGVPFADIASALDREPERRQPERQ
jgi:RNA polymerase sigma-70 factor (ECF subfamily)